MLGFILCLGGNHMYYKVKEVSDMVGLSVRMLHHYDKIDLLKPDHVTSAGYRQYSEENLELLQQILFLRELEFSLNEIKVFMEHQSQDYIGMLDKQQMLLKKKAKRLNKIIDTIEKTKDKYKRGEIMTAKERFEGFDSSDFEANKEQYAKEAEERWGHSEAFQESKRRTSKYSPDDFKRIQDETDKVYKQIVGLMHLHVSDPGVQTLVASLRDGITEHFYDCTLDIFRGLGQMYVDDPRFTKNLEKHGHGFAAYLSRAIEFYCDQQA